MRLQVAIDRVTLDKALEIAGAVAGLADILEVGTSLIKDYGLAGSVGVIKKQFPGQSLLADLKTMDEGAYEFEQAFAHGADFATVMGAAAPSTIAACHAVAAGRGKGCVIDLLGLEAERIARLGPSFPDAIYCLHLPTDGGGDVADTLQRLGPLLPAGTLAAAGGIGLKTIPALRRHRVEIAIVGGAITKAGCVRTAAMAFRRALDAAAER